MPDSFGFNHFGITRGNYTVQCIEDDCDASGPKHYWTDEMRRIHFYTHRFEEGVGVDGPVIKGQKRTDKCRICGNSFDQERRRGRPRVLCYVCKPE